MLNPAIYNAGKTDYDNCPIFFGQPRGLVDTINKQYQEHTNLYEKLRGSDWTEKEFVFEMCKVDFQKCDPIYANDMLSTIGYQWETDSTASSTIATIMGCVVSSSAVFTGYQRISDNESIHALTYAKIVSQSFDNPAAILERFKANKNAMARLEVVAKVFEDAYVSAHRWALYQARPNVFPLTYQERYEIYNHIFLYVVALLIMERVQFMSSFAVTFGICELLLFQPIGDAVARIAQDEIETHVPYGRETIRCMLQTDRGREAFKENKHVIVAMLNEAIRSEERWVEVTHDDGHELPGAPPSSLLAFSHFGGTDVASFLGLREDVAFPLVETNPLSYMNKRVNLSSVQASPQEAPPTAYMVNAVTRDDEGAILDFEM